MKKSLFVLALVTMFVVGVSAEEKKPKIQKKLDSIKIPHLEFNQVPMTKVLELLNKKSKELDPEKKGVGLFLKLQPGDVPQVTMVVDDISLGDAIMYICKATNLEYRVENNTVVIQRKKQK